MPAPDTAPEWAENRDLIERLTLDDGAEVTLLIDRKDFHIVGLRGPSDAVLGHPAEKLRGERLMALRPNREQGRRVMPFGPALLEEPGYYGEIAIGGSDGQNRSVAMRVQPFDGASGQPLVLVRMVDVTEQVRLDQDVRDMHRKLQAAYTELTRNRKSLDEARRAASLSNFAAGLSHELNNPVGSAYSNLSSLEGYIQDLSEAHFSKGPVPEELTEIRDISSEVCVSLKRVSDIVRKLNELEIPIRKQPFDFVDAVKSKVSGIRFEAPPKLPAESDPSALGRLLDQVIDNARWVSGEGGALAVQLMPKDDQAVITIEDSGPGVPEEILERIFDPFFTTRPPGAGLGLGLFLARRSAARLGGEITLENRPGGGARCVITLPLVLPEREEQMASYEGFRTSHGLPD